MSTIITDNPYTFTVADNMNINAVFEDDVYRVNVYMYPKYYDYNGTLTSSKNYSGGSNCTLTYTSSSDLSRKVFGWYDLDTGELLRENSNTYSFTVNSNKNIIAAVGHTDGLKGNADDYESFSSANQTVIDVNGNTITYVKDGNSYYYGDAWKVKYFKYTGTGYSYNNYKNTPLFWFNQIHNSSYPLQNARYRDTGWKNRADTYCVAFGPFVGDTIYIDSVWSTSSGMASIYQMDFYFSSPIAPTLSNKILLGTYSHTIYYPSYGIGYDTTWKNNNFINPGNASMSSISYRP
jgi:hypothetical protein